MKLRWILFVATALLLTILVSPLQTANAYADVSSYALTCSSFSASGSSDAPYVTLSVSDYDGILDYFIVIPVVSGTYSGTLTFPGFPAGTLLDVEVWGSLNTYSTYEDDGYWDEDSYFYDYINCVPAPVGNGPDIPASFTMHTIICDTPVYDSPVGSLVGSASVKLGQTFYANPVDAIAADGSHWTQIFVGAWTYPYIPSACAQ